MSCPTPPAAATCESSAGRLDAPPGARLLPSITLIGVGGTAVLALWHLAAVLCCRPRDRLSHSFHWSLREPPFRPRPRGPATAGGALVVPACFLPSEARGPRRRHAAVPDGLQARLLPAAPVAAGVATP